MEDIIRREIRRIIREKFEAIQATMPAVGRRTSERMVLLTEEQVSDWLEVPVSTIRDWRQKKINIPFIPFSDRKVRYSEEAVTSCLRSIEVQTAA